VTGGKPKISLSQPGVFAACEKVEEIEEFDWPSIEHLDFSQTLGFIDHAASKGMAIFGGMWMPYFHVLCDFFGMENYFIKMHTHPDVVEAATERVVSFYLEANERCLECMGEKLDAVFFGNDLGSQQDLLVSPQLLERFVFPWMRKIIDQAKAYDKKIVLHSCGAVSKIIPTLIEAGIDGLHPLQARARGMEAENLARRFKGELVFIGGVDTQELLPFGSPEKVSAEVNRLKELLGPRFVVSPSHEALLPNVGPDKVVAMRDAALERTD
jgi:uroporphyrinogen decarboxylase